MTFKGIVVIGRPLKKDQALETFFNKEGTFISKHSRAYIGGSVVKGKCYARAQKKVDSIVAFQEEGEINYGEIDSFVVSNKDEETIVWAVLRRMEKTGVNILNFSRTGARNNTLRDALKMANQIFVSVRPPRFFCFFFIDQLI